MKPCAAMHPMLRIHPDILTEEDRLLGEWFRCPRCDKVALIPADKWASQVMPATSVGRTSRSAWNRRLRPDEEH